MFPAASSAFYLATLKRCVSPVGTGSGTTSASTAGWRGNPPARSAAHRLPRVQAAPDSDLEGDAIFFFPEMGRTNAFSPEVCTEDPAPTTRPKPEV